MASCCASGPGSSMQKLRAWRKRCSLPQRFSSTRMRCITAICPAGPPNDSAATRAHTRRAAEKGAATAGSARGTEALVERLEQRQPRLQPVLVALVLGGDALHHGADPGGLGVAEAALLAVEVVHDL